ESRNVLLDAFDQTAVVAFAVDHQRDFLAGHPRLPRCVPVNCQSPFRGGRLYETSNRTAPATALRCPKSNPPFKIRLVSWTDWIGLGSTIVVALAALIGILRFLLPAVARQIQQRRKPQAL